MDASQVTVDILNNPRYQGAIESISWLTDWVDAGFAGIITFVAFFIISVAMLKNVLAGAYCAFPKFWDKVDQAHKEVEGQGWFKQVTGTFQQNKWQEINMGTLSKALMRILPNIKTLTDFDNDTLAAKQYFITAIPQMCLVIIIGAFIYNGYYRDTAAKVVDFGSEMFYRVVLEADPIALFDQITNTAGRPDFATNDSVNPRDKFLNKVSQEVYTTIIGTYNDISTAEQKSALASASERWVIETIGGPDNDQYVGVEEWKAKVSASLVLGANGAPDTTYMNKKSDDGLTVQIAYVKPITDFNLASNKEIGKPWYVRVIVNFTKVPVSDGKVSRLTDLVYHMPRSKVAPGSTTIITLTDSASGDDGIKFKQSGSNVEVVIDGKTLKGRLVGNTKLELSEISNYTTKDSDVYTVNNLYYTAGGKDHVVSKIQLDGGNKFTSALVPDFKYGSAPIFQTEETGTKENDTKK